MGGLESEDFGELDKFNGEKGEISNSKGGQIY